jgi:hypothetical protein
VKHIKDVLHEMYEEDHSLDKQTGWLTEYKLDPITLGRMCEKYPTLQNSWNEFKLVYELCRSQYDIDRQDT